MKKKRYSEEQVAYTLRRLGRGGMWTGSWEQNSRSEARNKASVTRCVRRRTGYSDPQGAHARIRFKGDSPGSTSRKSPPWERGGEPPRERNARVTPLLLDHHDFHASPAPGDVEPHVLVVPLHLQVHRALSDR